MSTRAWYAIATLALQPGDAGSGQPGAECADRQTDVEIAHPQHRPLESLRAHTGSPTPRSGTNRAARMRWVVSVVGPVSSEPTPHPVTSEVGLLRHVHLGGIVEVARRSLAGPERHFDA